MTHDQSRSISEVDSVRISQADASSAQLYRLKLDYTASDIVEVIKYDPSYAAYYLELTNIEGTERIRHTVNRMISVAKRQYGDVESTDLIRRLDEDISQHDRFADYRTLFDVVHADVQKSKAFEQFVIDLLKRPVWSFELFAAVSMGRKPSDFNEDVRPNPKGSAAKKFKSLLSEYRNRVGLLRRANALPEDDLGHLSASLKPLDLVRWAIKNGPFELYPLLYEIGDKARFGRLKRRANKSKTMRSGEEPTKHDIESLRRLCMMLVACVARVPPRRIKPLFPPPKTNLRSRFIGELRARAASILDVKDVLDDETTRKHLSAAFNNLSADSQDVWQRVQREL